jgi:hypothetical protein
MFHGNRPGRKDVKFKKILRALRQHYKQKLIDFYAASIEDHLSNKEAKSKASKDILLHDKLKETATKYLPA